MANIPSTDFTQAATQQGQANQQAALGTAKLSNPNVYNPYGSQTVQYDANGQPTITQSLTPTAQGTFESQQAVQKAMAQLGQTAAGNLGSTYGQAFNPNLPNMTMGLDTSNLAAMPVNAGMSAQNAILSRLEPTLQRQRDQLNTQLVNQGLVPGTEAYNTSMTQQGQQENDLRTQAALQGINLDLAARQQGLNEQGTLGNFANNAISQSLAQQLQMRNQPLSELSNIMGQSSFQAPTFQGYTGATIGATPYMQAAGNQASADLAKYGIQTNNQNAATQGWMGIGNSLLNTPMSAGSNTLFGQGLNAIGGLFGLGGSTPTQQALYDKYGLSGSNPSGGTAGNTPWYTLNDQGMPQYDPSQYGASNQDLQSIIDQMQQGGQFNFGGLSGLYDGTAYNNPYPDVMPGNDLSSLMSDYYNNPGLYGQMQIDPVTGEVVG
jgi:hypothetical protein